MELTSRKEKILSAVVRDYVQGGEPVGSKAIAEEIGVSSATVRNEMAELTELGLLEQPHTSAGRVPSQKGYRQYVDRLMTVPELAEEERQRFRAALLGSGYEPERIFTRACRLLADVSHCVSVAAVPNGAMARVRALQFVQTSRRTAMLLLMSSAGTMKTRVFRCDFDLSGEMMRVFFRMFNEKVAGKAVVDITPAFLQTAAASMGEMYALAAFPLQALLEAARDTLETEVIVGGQMNLLLSSELEHRPILDLLDRKTALTRLLDQKPGRVTALIGEESRLPELRNASLLVCRCEAAGRDAGALAVLGPTRMDYGRMTAILRCLSGEIGRMLDVLLREE